MIEYFLKTKPLLRTWNNSRATARLYLSPFPNPFSLNFLLTFYFQSANIVLYRKPMIKSSNQVVKL